MPFIKAGRGYTERGKVYKKCCSIEARDKTDKECHRWCVHWVYECSSEHNDQKLTVSVSITLSNEQRRMLEWAGSLESRHFVFCFIFFKAAMKESNSTSYCEFIAELLCSSILWFALYIKNLMTSWAMTQWLIRASIMMISFWVIWPNNEKNNKSGDLLLGWLGKRSANKVFTWPVQVNGHSIFFQKNCHVSCSYWSMKTSNLSPCTPWHAVPHGCFWLVAKK